MKKIKIKSPEHKLLLCCSNGSFEEVQNFINDGADVNARVPYINDKIEYWRYGARAWCRPIHLAARNPDMEILKLLHTSGAKLAVYDFERSTPLFYAVQKNSLEVFQYLVRNGLDPHATDKYGYNLLYYSACNPNKDVIKELLRHGAKLNSTVDGKAALDAACRFGTLEDVKFLIDQGADVVQNLKQTTNIMFHKEENILYLFEWCIKQGIDLDKCLDGKCFDASWSVSSVLCNLGLKNFTIRMGHGHIGLKGEYV